MQRTIMCFLGYLIGLGPVQTIRAQQMDDPLWLKLESIAQSDSFERHFAGVYVWATRAADAYIATLPDTPKMLMNRVQAKFAGFFLKGISDADEGLFNPVWSGYFLASDLSPIQYKLLGTNTHINGDSWRVLVNGFTAEELRIVAPYYHHCTQELHSVLDSLHGFAMQSSRRMKTLHRLSLGVDKSIAKHLLRKWRLKQFQIGEAQINRPSRMIRLQRQAERRRKRMEWLILKVVR